MGQYMRATARKKYSCAWKCTQCQKVNTEVGEKTGTAQVGYGLIGVKKVQAEQLSRTRAEADVDKKLDRLQKEVNVQHSYHHLTVRGVCASCGKKQPWHVSPMIKYLLCAAYVVIYVLSTNLLYSSDYSIFLPLIAGVVIIWFGFDIILNLLARKKIESTGDQFCYPLVIGNEVPQGLSADDPRLQAIAENMR